jgi:SAM-dependent methyltransferase
MSGFPHDVHALVVEHLASWGLRRFTTDAAYFRWQRERLSSSQLTQLQQMAAQRRASGSAEADRGFYDLAADPQVLPVLYSQRYEYYSALGPLLAERIGSAKTVVDVGCGVGLLTTYLARCRPDVQFLGVDRSAHSLESAHEQSQRLGVGNIEWRCSDLQTDAAPFRVNGPDTPDLMIASHCLFQAEQELGIPSRTWRTFERDLDPVAQAPFEERTGLGEKLNHVVSALSPDGRLLLFEKARLLSRRIPFQRALAARGLRLREQPIPLRYQEIEEVTEDGPLYHLQRVSQSETQPIRTVPIPWNEAPEEEAGDLFLLVHAILERSDCKGETASTKAPQPLFTCQTAAAQAVWEALPDRLPTQSAERVGGAGRVAYVELGQVRGFCYLYCANTYDQRQLVIMREHHQSFLQTSYQEIIGSL